MSSVAPIRALGTRERVIVALWAVAGFGLVTWRFGFGWPGFIVIGLATGLAFGQDRSLRGALVVTRDWIGLFAFLGLMIYSVFGFFDAETTRAQIAWAAGFVYTLIMIMGIKIWYWNELNKNALIREVKRLELQIARLSSRLDG